MKKSKVLTYSAIFFCICTSLILSVTFPALNIMKRMGVEPSVSFNNLEVFLDIMASLTNYLSYARIMLLYLPAFAFCLNYIFLSDKSCFIVRLKSRREYVIKHIVDILIFTAIFVFLVEVVNIVFSFLVFGPEMTINSGLLQYSAIDFVTEFLFYMRVGIVLFITGILINKKYSPLVTFVIYFAEFYLKGYTPIFRNFVPNDLWYPYEDAVVVTTLLTGEISPISVVLIIIRGITMNVGLLILAYYLFKKKDIINNEKK